MKNHIEWCPGLRREVANRQPVLLRDVGRRRSRNSGPTLT